MWYCCLRYCKSTIFQANHNSILQRMLATPVVCDTAKVRFFKQITTGVRPFARCFCCLRYCKSTIFQANHNTIKASDFKTEVVCDTAKVRFFKQITTPTDEYDHYTKLFAILQKYDFSSKSQPNPPNPLSLISCLRYCKSTIFQANHNQNYGRHDISQVVCDTAKVRFFKQITTR